MATGFFERVNADIRRMVRKKRSNRRAERGNHRRSTRQGHGGIRRRVGCWRLEESKAGNVVL